jgi:hypothetical protein
MSWFRHSSARDVGARILFPNSFVLLYVNDDGIESFIGEVKKKKEKKETFT